MRREFVSLTRRAVVGLAFGGALMTSAYSGGETSDKPNIMLILADDLGYGDLSSYGATKVRTPTSESLATQGVLFTDAHTGASTCTPTRYGLMTGRHGWRTWLKCSALSTSAPLLIEVDRMTVASLLKSAGYSTSILGKWHLGFGREEGFGENRGDTPPNCWETRASSPDWNGELKPGPLEVGFDYSYVIPVPNSFPPYVFVENHHFSGLRADSPIGTLESRHYGRMEGGDGARWTDEELIDRFASKRVSQLESLAKEQPFFLSYTPTQPHVGSRSLAGQQRWPNGRFQGTSLAGPFGEVIPELDWSVGEILDSPDRLGIAEDTLVIFSSDSGGYTRDFNGHRPNGPILRGGKGDLVEGGHRVPFLARWPGKIKPGTRSGETISLTDMMATLAAIVGVELPPGAGPDSFNVLPALLWKELPDSDRPMVMMSGGMGALSIRAGKWKLIDGQGNCGYAHFRAGKPMPEPQPGDHPAQLYDLEEDVGERNNLYGEHPEIVRHFEALLQLIKGEELSRPL